MTPLEKFISPKLIHSKTVLSVCYRSGTVNTAMNKSDAVNHKNIYTLAI